MDKPKIFCIGLNKTGTTSLKKAFKDLDFIVADEARAKPLFYHWAKRDFTPIIKFCRSAQVFQDSPFSFPYTFVALDQAFPNAKFILTIRDNDEQWYQSITKFHSKLWGFNDGSPPTKEQMIQAVNTTPGRPWEVNRVLFNTPENDPYMKGKLIEFYNQHNATIIDYFKTRPEKLLVINISNKESYQEFVDFIGVKSRFSEFPWENKTS